MLIGAFVLDITMREEDTLAYWREHDINNKVRKLGENGKKYYFLDGPPYVTGDLHQAQIWTKAMKDAFVRYKRYKRLNVVDRAGYDIHGLPIENRVEKELGVTSKKDIENKIGIAKFVEECRSYVEKYIGRMDADYERFGVSLDFKNPYLPYKKEYIEIGWSILKKIHDKGLLYKGKRTLIYCPHCETPLSQGSMEVEYSEEQDPSIVVAFEIDTKHSKSKMTLPEKTALAVWTTTPWTLPANVSIAVNPKELYVLINSGGRNLIVAKSRLDAFGEMVRENFVIKSEFYGSELVGLYYTSPLASKISKQAELAKYHKVIGEEGVVSMEEGTGVLHVAPGHGIEDYTLGMRNKLPIVSLLNSDATYNEEGGTYKGLKVPAEANAAVLKDLKELGVLLYSGTLKHSYPHCWRCHSKLIFMATDQWFLNIQKVKKRLLKQNEKVNWHPSEVGGWQADLLTNSPDWCISRQRYWGIPMPIWECRNCKERSVVGSIAELKGKSINKDVELNDLHRPYIDAVKLNCDKCNGEMQRVKDTLDVWFDSGIAFRASLSEEQFETLFPVDLVLEYVEQTRGWFQYLLKCSVMAYSKKPFEHAVVHGIMFGTDGRKMSKSFGNYKSLAESLTTASADAFRLWSINHVPILNRNLNEQEIIENDRTVSVMYNISSLLAEYQPLLGTDTQGKIKAPTRGLRVEDEWILSRLESVCQSASQNFEDYELYKAAEALKYFITEDFSRFYLKLAKKRVAEGVKKDAKTIAKIVNYVLYKTIVLMSPIVPFVTEAIFLERYKQGESVFMMEWPKTKKQLINQELEGEVEIAREAITALLNSREKANVKLRWPLAKGTLEVKDDKTQKALEKLSVLIEGYTNIKEVGIKRVEGFGKEVRPIFAKIGPDFKEKAGAVAEALKKEDADKLESAITSSGHYSLHTDKGTVNITVDHFTIIQKLEDANAIIFKYGIASVDKEMNKELWEEGMVREVERRIQMARKEKQLKKTDKVEVFYEASVPLAEIMTKNAEKIKKDVNAKKLHSKLKDGSAAQETEIEEEKLKLEVEKLDG